MERLDRAEVADPGEGGSDHLLQPHDERVQSIRQAGHQQAAGVAADHVEFIGPEHRQFERLGEHQRPARLNKRADGLGPRVVPAVGADEHRVADGGVEQAIPAAQRRHLEPAQRALGHIEAGHEPVTPADGGRGNLGDPRVAAQKSKAHHGEIWFQRLRGQPVGPVRRRRPSL